MPARTSFMWTWAGSGVGSFFAGIGITTRQQPIELGVLSVDIVKKSHFTALQNDRRGVDDQDRNGPVEIDLERLCTVHRVVYAFRRPFRLVAEHPRRQLFRFLDANAAMTEITAGLGE